MLGDNSRMCSRCVMDSTAQGIEFDENGVCNYCRDFERNIGKYFEEDAQKRGSLRERFIDEVKARGKGKQFDCIVGVSGGVDSSWTLVKTKELGLRPLAVHMDNGWNSELAQNNISNLVRGLGVELYTHVIEWPEYRGLMDAFFASDVIDIELLYDNAMLALNYQQAAKYGLRYILAGTNVSTEGMRMPSNWNWSKYDEKNIKAISKRFGGPKLKTFPSIGTRSFLWYAFVKRIRWVSFLDMINYRKEKALERLTQDFGYKPYAQKHYESVFTRFYQGYILPEKFGVDKRKLHWSTLVLTNQVTRADALKALGASPYPSEWELQQDIAYFIKKMAWTEEALDRYISREEVPHDHYGSERKAWEKLLSIYRSIKKRKAIRN